MQRLKAKLTMVIPVMAAALLGLVLSNLTMTQTAAVKASPFDDVERVQRTMTAEVTRATEMATDPVPVAKLLEMRSGGAGFQPQSESGECVCNCDCLDEAAIRRIVSDEFNNQKLAEAIAPRSYGSPVVSTPTVTYSPSPATYSQPVVYSQPVYSQPQMTTTVRRGLFGRRVVTTQAVPQSAPISGTCRIVNGVQVCTP
jgi:type II secretory pathway pseudopilin PulG